MAKAQRSSEGIRVFVSYSHKDEDLRAELEKHLSLLNQQGLISTWHDRKIMAGEEWEGKIDENLNSAQIILLLVSSDFLASEYCNEVEIKRALERHKSGEARVIPIILRYVYWEGALFAGLQALPTNAEPVKDGNWRSIDAAFTDVAKGLEKVIRSFNPMILDESGLVPTKKSQKTIIVDQMCQGDHATITEAIKAANPGDKIVILPGLYEEGLELDKPLEIKGEGKREDIEIRATGKHTLAFKAASGRVANLTLRQMSEDDFYCADISSGRLMLEDCDLSSQGKMCISIRGPADPRLRRNTIHDNKGNGISVTDKGQGILEENDIFGSDLPQVAIVKGGNPILRRNRIHDGKSNGIRITNNGKGILEENDIFGHDFPQVAIDSGGNPTLRNNRIHDGKGNGVRIFDNGQGILEENDIFGHNEFSQVIIETGSNPTLRNNRIHDSKSCGISITCGSGIFENNDLRNNKKGAWNISNDSDLSKIYLTNNLV
jgi:parallel beta-helix repeat protein